jgi:hypothetical protein
VEESKVLSDDDRKDDEDTRLSLVDDSDSECSIEAKPTRGGGGGRPSEQQTVASNSRLSSRLKSVLSDSEDMSSPHPTRK